MQEIKFKESRPILYVEFSTINGKISNDVIEFLKVFGFDEDVFSPSHHGYENGKETTIWNAILNENSCDCFYIYIKESVGGYIVAMPQVPLPDDIHSDKLANHYHFSSMQKNEFELLFTIEK